MVRSMSRLSAALAVAASLLSASAYDNSRTDNVVAYWGQNSYGATHSDQANWQTNLAHYCQDSSIDAIPLAFLTVFFSTGGLPEINLANSCNSVDDGVFSGTSLANCQSMASDIKTCQAAGKIITLSLGGATGAATFSSDAQAETFAQTVWDLFLGGSSSTRPFGDAVLDGLDLDIEGGGSTGFAAFVTKIRSLSASAGKTYYITAAPQCVFPDAYLGSVISAVGFDAIYVQFYNNWCGLQNYANADAWNFGTWDNWAKTASPNANVKIYIGAPASSTAAGSGYVDAGTLSTIAQETRSKYSSFGGVMFWDASQAYANGRIDTTLKNALANGSGGGGTTTTTTQPTTTTAPTTTTSTTTAPATTTTAGSGTGSCAGVAAWDSSVAYVGGSQVTYNGDLWTAKWWSEADTPGGAAGVWTDNGACASALKEAVATEAPTLTDSRHVVDKQSSVNVVTAATALDAEVTSTTQKRTSRMKKIRNSAGF
ncbi:class III chitinase [Hymenopellis radicata]|nr:class III chitinase [Hymenopellis radicata]